MPMQTWTGPHARPGKVGLGGEDARPQGAAVDFLARADEVIE
jgi:hypothetical protein